MIDLLKKRFWRSLVTGYLPPVLKDRIRARLQDYGSKSRPRFDISFEQQGDHLMVHIGDEIHLKITEDLKPDLIHQFQTSSEMAEEMHGFISESRDKEVLFDIGAAKGLFSLVFCATGPHKRSVAFEASPTITPVAQSLIDINNLSGRICLKNYAIGNTESQIVLYEDSTGLAQSIVDSYHSNPLKVDARTLDKECKRLSIFPDLMKIDVEGYELEVLNGCEALLAEKHPSICLELHLNYLERRGIPPETVLEILDRHNYSFFTSSGAAKSARSISDSLSPVVRFIARSV